MIDCIMEDQYGHTHWLQYRFGMFIKFWSGRFNDGNYIIQQMNREPEGGASFQWIVKIKKT